MIKIRFQDNLIQKQYEDLINGGMNWKRAEYKVKKGVEEYDKGGLV